MTETSPVRVIGFGNPFRGDDTAGLDVAEALRARGFDAQALVGTGADLVNLWDGLARVIVVDAMTSGAPAGTIQRFDAAHAPLPREAFGVSSHLFGIAEAVDLARGLGRLPAEVIVYGIEGRDFTMGAEASPAVCRAVAEVVRRVAAEIGLPQADCLD